MLSRSFISFNLVQRDSERFSDLPKVTQPLWDTGARSQAYLTLGYSVPWLHHHFVLPWRPGAPLCWSFRSKIGSFISSNRLVRTP